MTLPQTIFQVAFIGIGATAVMDLWLMFIQRMGVPTLNFALIGRWAGHLLEGRFSHPAIGKAAPVRGELVWGWVTHYAVGVGFAGLLVAAKGTAWASNPTLGPAVAVGFFTVLIPLFVMQPAMGAGFASSKTPTPLKNCLRSMVNHTVFGFGLYLSAAFGAFIARAV